MIMKKTPKNAKLFYCNNCSFECCKNSEYTRHLLTRKHKMITNDNEYAPHENKESVDIFTCHCGNMYKYQSGLSRHKLKCVMNTNTDMNITEEEHTHQSLQDSTNILSMFSDMMNQNKELQDLLIIQQQKHEQQHQEELKQQQEELKQQQEALKQQKQQHQEELKQFQQETQKQLLELAQETNKVIHNNTNSHNTINNRFNMNFFLNEQCKDAMNLSDFLNNIEVSLEDVSNVGRLGYADGISRIIINALKDMDVYERPIHCSDIKREIMYIKDNDIWEKDDERKYQMKRVLKLISHKNVKRLLDWREAHPGWLVYDSKEEAECLRITNESMGGGSDEENERLYKKMIRKIAHETLIDKKIVE